MRSLFKKNKFFLFAIVTLLFSTCATAGDYSETRPIFSVGSLSAPERVDFFYSPSCSDSYLAFRNAVSNLISNEVQEGKVLLTAYLMPRNADDIDLGASLSCVPQSNFGSLIIEYMIKRSSGVEYTEQDLDRLVKKHGSAADTTKNCLTEKKIDQLKKINAGGIDIGIKETPSWHIRGRLHQDVYFYWQLQDVLSK